MSTTIEIDNDEHFTVNVFRDSPEFDKVSKWFMVPMHILMDLHVEEFVCSEDCRMQHIAQLEAMYPDHVLVY